MRTSLVSAVVLGLVSAALAVPAGFHGLGKFRYHPDPSPCTEGQHPNATDVQGFPSTPPTDPPTSKGQSDNLPTPTESIHKSADPVFLLPSQSSGEAAPTSVPPTASTPLPEDKGEKKVTQPQDDGTSLDIEAYVKLHNDLRAKHGAPALEYNADLADHAKKHSEECLDENGELEHSTDGLYGENLCWNYESTEACINDWYAEGGNYDYGKKDPNQAGHFTQVIWKATKQIGCGVAMCANKEGITGPLVTCNYDTGNVIGQYGDNVLRPLS